MRRFFGPVHERLDANMPSPESLRRARTRADLCAMLVVRAWFESMDFREVNLHVFADASPQWRGVELFSATLDIMIPRQQFHRRMLLPMVSLRNCDLDWVGKTLTLLWQFSWCLACHCFARCAAGFGASQPTLALSA